MVDSTSLATAVTLLTSSAPIWLPSVRDAFLNQGANLGLDKSIQSGRKWLHIDEKEQMKHFKRVLRNAAERSILKFSEPEDRDQLRNILTVLSEQGSHLDTFRSEVMRLLTVSDSPNIEALSDLYNHSLRFRMLNQATAPQGVDVLPYLSVFFQMLKEELYSDTFFHDHIRDALNSNVMLDIQRSCSEVIEALHLIGGILADDYTTEQFEQDLHVYITHVESTLRRLKLVGVVPKDRGSENVDPELELIFVPLRIAPLDSEKSDLKKPQSIISWLEDSPYLVLLGGPGSGKSTAIRFLAWSHAIANLSASSSSISYKQVLSDKPIPLRFELRRLVEDRRQYPAYDFLDYATDILLKRAGVQVNRHMFEELLERRLMLCLFDGLDEVATLDDRQRLITEIEEFARCYPGNRIIVTSRPVGYELARFSKQSFSHAQVNEFDDRQIRIFLVQWYSHVLKLKPILPDDQQELEAIYKTLKENSRLHTLATNPLLLTVITALHRYERLPDRRILVYDRCAELLLDTWAKLKGTDARWKDMRMSKDDQRACIAHLGFVLHRRSHEKISDTEDIKDYANDVTSRFLLKQIEFYLKNRGLISEVVEQHAEAENFLKLMQIEAGLIVERGKDESGNDIYGFVHRTFQEYFAAVDVNEQYLEEEDPKIISQFIINHLHDPYWHEVILLLLGKLRRKPVTTQLRQILEGKSRRSQYAEILQQDLFFVCTCLIEEISVDNELAEYIILRLISLIKSSPFPSQAGKAFDLLVSLTRTKQYSKLGLKELKDLVTKDMISDVSQKVEAIQLLYKGHTQNLPERQQALQELIAVLQRPELSIELRIEAAQLFARYSKYDSPERQQALQELVAVLKRTDLTVEQRVKVTQAINQSSLYDSQEQQLVFEELLEMLQRTDLTVELRIEISQLLYLRSHFSTDEKKQALQELKGVLQRTNLTVDQYVKVAEALQLPSLEDSLEQQRAVQELIKMLQRSDLTVEQRVKVDKALYQSSSYDSLEEQQALQELTKMLQQPDLTVEQRVKVAEALYQSSAFESSERRQAHQDLIAVLQRNDLTVEQRVKVAEILYQSSLNDSLELQQVIEELKGMLQRNDLTVEQRVKVAEILYQSSLNDSLELQQVIEELKGMLQRNDLTVEQRVKVAEILYQSSSYDSLEEQQALQELTKMLQRPDLTIEQRIKVAGILYYFSSDDSPEVRQVVQELAKMLQRPDITLEQRVQAAAELYNDSLSGSQEERQAIEELMEMLQRTDLTVEQRVMVADTLYYPGSHYLQGKQELIGMLQRTDLTINQLMEVVDILFRKNYGLQKRWMVQKIRNIIQDQDLIFEQRIKVAYCLYKSIRMNSFRHWILQWFINILEDFSLTIERRLEVIRMFHLCSSDNASEEQAVLKELRMMLTRTDLIVEQRAKIAQTLYLCIPDKSQERRQLALLLFELLQQNKLTVDQKILVTQSIFLCSPYRSEERQQAIQKFEEFLKTQELTLEHRLQIACFPLTVEEANYADRVWSIRAILALVDEEIARIYIKKCWIFSDDEVQASDIMFIAELIKEEVLPTEIQDAIYISLENMIPKFDNEGTFG